VLLNEFLGIHYHELCSRKFKEHNTSPWYFYHFTEMLQVMHQEPTYAINTNMIITHAEKGDDTSNHQPSNECSSRQDCTLFLPRQWDRGAIFIWIFHKCNARSSLYCLQINIITDVPFVAKTNQTVGCGYVHALFIMFHIAHFHCHFLYQVWLLTF